MTPSPGDTLITLRTVGPLRRGDVVTVASTSPSGEYVYLEETGGKQGLRAEYFMVAVRRPWWAWAEPGWAAQARAAAEGFVRDGLPSATLLGMPVRVDPSLPREVEFMLESPAPVATEAEIRAEAEELRTAIREWVSAEDARHVGGSSYKLVNRLVEAENRLRSLAVKETER